MTVSDKMIVASAPHIYFNSEDKELRPAEEVAQAVINAAWTRFDPEDLSTHPVMAGNYLIMWKYDGCIERLYLKHDGKWGTAQDVSLITHWADPATLTPD